MTEKKRNDQELSLQESDILRALIDKPFINQRILSEETGHSLGIVNRSLHQLTEKGFLDDIGQVTSLSKGYIRSRAPKNAIILAAGSAMRTVPVNMYTQKALLEVKGERLIERLITQLRDVGIKNITVVVGFMKESFEYLIDEYGVELIYDPHFASNNSIDSMSLVLDRLNNTYIIPCDIWCACNPFRRNELYSWYMVSDAVDDKSTLRVNRKMELVTHTPGNRMIGISYLLKKDAEQVRRRIQDLIQDNRNDNLRWEEALLQKDRMTVHARIVQESDFVEINSYEQLRELDSDANRLKPDAVKTIEEALGCNSKDITDISVLKKGLINHSFLFSAGSEKYIIRIPEEGTDQFIDRKQEAEVYKTISGSGLCDEPVYINPENGIKITKYTEGVRGCDSTSKKDLIRCMDKLKYLHSLHLTVPHSIDIFGQIEFYESLWNGTPSIFRDYVKTKENVFSLRRVVDGMEKDWCLTHMDAAPDSFLFYTGNGEKEKQLQLINWEYAGMQDPHVDIAKFCVNSLYNKKQCDELIDIYFEGACSKKTRLKIYCYISMCGLLCSNWCEYKRNQGIEIGECSLRQYRFAKEYYRHVEELLDNY